MTTKKSRSVDEIMADLDAHEPSKRAGKDDLYYEPGGQKGKPRDVDAILNDIDSHEPEQAPPKKREWYQDAVDQAGHLVQDIGQTSWGIPGEVLSKPVESMVAAGGGLYAGMGSVVDATANLYRAGVNAVPASRAIPPVAMGEQFIKDINTQMGRDPNAPAMIGPTIKQLMAPATAQAPNMAHAGELYGMLGGPAATGAITAPGMAAVHVPGKAAQWAMTKAGPQAAALLGKPALGAVRAPELLGKVAGGATTGLAFGTAGGVNQQIQAGQPIDVGQALHGSQGLGLVGGGMPIAAPIGKAAMAKAGKSLLREQPAPQPERPTTGEMPDPQAVLRQYYKDPGSVRLADVQWASREIDRMHREEVSTIKGNQGQPSRVVQAPPENIRGNYDMPPPEIQTRTGSGNQLPILYPRNKTAVRAPERGGGMRHEPRPDPNEPIDVEYTPTETPPSRRLSDRSREPITPPSPRERAEGTVRELFPPRDPMQHPDAKGEAQASPEYLVDRIRRATDTNVLRQIAEDPNAPDAWQAAAYERWMELDEKPAKPREQNPPGSEPKQPEREQEPARHAKEEPKQLKLLTQEQHSELLDKEAKLYPNSETRFAGSKGQRMVYKDKGGSEKPTITAYGNSWSPRELGEAGPEYLDRMSDQLEAEAARKGITPSRKRELNQQIKAISDEKMRLATREAQGIPTDDSAIRSRIDSENARLDEEVLKTQSPQSLQKEGSEQPSVFEAEPAADQGAGGAEAPGTAKNSITPDRVRQLEKEFTTSDAIARQLKRENPELKDTMTHKELVDLVRQQRSPERAQELESVKRVPISRVEPPEGTQNAKSSFGHFSDGFEYFVREGKNKDRQVWKAPTGKAGNDYELVGDFATVRKMHPEIFEKPSKNAEKVERMIDSLKDKLDRRGRAIVDEVIEAATSEEGGGSALGFLDDAAAERIAQTAIGFVAKVERTIQKAKDPATRERWWDAAEEAANVMYDVDKMRHYDQTGLYREFMTMQGSLDRILRGVEIPKTAQIKEALSRAGKMTADEVMEMEGLTKAQKQFAIRVKMETEAFQERVKSRYEELSKELKDDDPYMRFLRDYYEYIAGKDIETGRGIGKESDALGNVVKDYWYDAVVSGNWHIHSIHLFDALVQGFGGLGFDVIEGGARAFTPDSAVRKFVTAHQGAGLIKASRYEGETSIKDKIDAYAERKIESVPGGKEALKLGRAIEGFLGRVSKIEALRAGVLVRLAKEMKYEGGAEQMAKDIMDGKMPEVQELEVYTRMASDLFDMIGYQALGVKNRNIWQRGEADLPGGGKLRFAPKNSSWGRLLQPFMGMRTVQSRLLMKMWGDVVSSKDGAEFARNIVPVLRLHTALAIHGGAATLPRAAQIAIYYTLGAPALNYVTQQLDKLNIGPLSVGHITPDVAPILFATWDNLANLVQEKDEAIEKLTQGDLKSKLEAAGAIFGGSVAGLPSFRNMAAASKTFGTVGGEKVTGVYEDLLNTKREKRRGQIKEFGYDNFQAMQDFFAPTHSRKDLHHQIQERLNRSRFLDWVKVAKGHQYPDIRKEVADADWFNGGKAEDANDWFEWRDKVNELYP